MNLKLKLVSLILAFLFVSPNIGFGYWVWSPEQGKFINPQSQIEDAADEQFKFSLSLYKENNLKRAEEEFENLIKQFPSSILAAESFYYKALIHQANADFYKAFKDYQKIIEKYPQSERVDEVVEKQYDIGNLYMGGTKEKFLGFRVVPSIKRAIEVFSKIVETSPYSAYGDKAQYQLARAYRAAKNLNLAGESYQKLIDNYPDSVLVDDARYEMAETIFLRSSSPDRDFRSLELAAQNFDQFVKEFPDSPIIDKAKKLKNVIDLKTAEKNFKIAEYYEKDNFAESALIYYEDVVRSYPDTEWGQRAQKKINQLRQPGKFLEQRLEQLEAKRRDVEMRKTAILAKENTLKGAKSSQLESELNSEKTQLKDLEKILKKEESRFDKNKKQSLVLRRRALDRDKVELKVKAKKLKEKRKLLKKNPSDDLRRALDRWDDGLQAERYSLARRESELIRLEDQFGVKTDRLRLLKSLPFVDKRVEMSETLQFKQKDLNKLIAEYEEIQQQKQQLFIQKQQLEFQLKSQSLVGLDGLSNKEELLKQIKANNPKVTELESKIGRENGQLSILTNQVIELEKQLARLGGSVIKTVSKIVTSPIALAKVPAGFVGGAIGQINPFNEKLPQTEQEKLKLLLEQRNQLQSKIEITADVVQTIQTTFEKELFSDLAEIEEKELNSSEEVPVVLDQKPQTLTEEMRNLTAEQRRERIQMKKDIKNIERKIRSRYEEIEDRKSQKAVKLNQLAEFLKERKRQGLLGPVTGSVGEAGLWVRYFFFGMGSEERQIDQQAVEVESDSDDQAGRIVELRESIELDNIMIEARAREISSLEKELNDTKRKASSFRGFKFRSILVDRSKELIRGTVEEASSIIPKKDKKEVLINRLDKETQKLSLLQAKQFEVDTAIKGLTQVGSVASENLSTKEQLIESATVEQAVKEAIVEKQTSVVPEVSNVERDMKKAQITRLNQQREDVQGLIAQKNKRLLNLKSDMQSELQTWFASQGVPLEFDKKENKKVLKNKKKISGEIREIQKDLVKVIEEEQEILEEEQDVYRKKLEQLNGVIEKMKKKADDRYQLLIIEKQTINTQLLQISKSLSNLETEKSLLAK